VPTVCGPTLVHSGVAVGRLEPTTGPIYHHTTPSADRWPVPIATVALNPPAVKGQAAPPRLPALACRSLHDPGSCTKQWWQRRRRSQYCWLRWEACYLLWRLERQWCNGTEWAGSAASRAGARNKTRTTVSHWPEQHQCAAESDMQQHQVIGTCMHATH